jgi:hypothetical protein
MWFLRTFQSPLVHNYVVALKCQIYDTGFQIPPEGTNPEDGNCSAIKNGKPSSFCVTYSQKPKISS